MEHPSTTNTTTEARRQAAIKAAGAAFAEAYRLLDTLPIEEAARRAYTPTGPSMDELIQRITARRAGNAVVAA